jgi:DNA-binding NarL/FixJ family response regulator
MNHSRHRIAIYEDNNALRESLKMIIDFTPGYTCVGAYPNGNNLLEDISSTKPEVILMDIDMPGISGIQAVELLKKHYPEVMVVMQTIFDDNDNIFKAICAGADGYLLKNTPPARLISGIEEVLEGGAPMSASVARKVLESQRSNTGSNDSALSGREKELLKLLVEGHSYKIVADKLFISVGTVQSHIKNIYSKLQVNSKAGAVAKAIRDKLV